MVGSSVEFGLVGMDALTVSMNRLPGGSGVATMAARGIAIGLITNTVVKLGITLIAGRRQFRRVAGAGLASTALVLGTILWLRW